MTTTTSTRIVERHSETPPIVALIQDAYRAGEVRAKTYITDQIAGAARWVELHGWRFSAPDFEALLADRGLDAETCEALRVFRERLVAERAAG